ncbi:MAG: MYXO-CTERM sorting domain-containing protein [Myxococcota bacterium]
MRAAAFAFVGSALLPAAVVAKTPAEMEPLTWMSIPDTKMRAVQADPEQYAELQGNGFPNVMLAWGGGVLDTTRLRMIIWGGGHNDYYGNEMYAFDIEALAWERLTEPTVDWNNCGDPNADGTANARHTYRSLAYVEHADRMFVSGGALNCFSGSCGADVTWAFDFESLAWNDRQPSGSHSSNCENSAEYDPATGSVYFSDTGGLYRYHYDDNEWTQLNADYLWAAATAIDTTRGVLLMIAEGEVWSYDIAGANFERTDWNTTGGDDFIAGTAQGLAYDPTTDRYVGWGGDTIYALDPETQAWETFDVPGAPEDLDGLRVWGRWRYVPGVNAFILITDVDTDVHFFKLSEGGMIPEPGGTGSSDGGDAGSAGDTAGDDGPDGEGGDAVDGPGTGAGVTGGDAGADGPSGQGTSAGGSSGAPAADGGGQDGGGCSCRATPSDARPWLALLVLAAVRRRRRLGAPT